MVDWRWRWPSGRQRAPAEVMHPMRRRSRAGSRSSVRGGCTSSTFLRLCSICVIPVLRAAPADLASFCNSQVVGLTNVILSDRKVVKLGSGDTVWDVNAISQALPLSIVVTPSNSSMNPDMRLYALNRTGGCLPVLNSHEVGGEYVRIDEKLNSESNATKYFVHVKCRGGANCRYHIAFAKLENDWQDILVGERRSGIAYHGVPEHFKFVCDERCAAAVFSGQSERVTFSVWPRDASSTKHLTLLVKKDGPPSTDGAGHLKASRGWFSGEVVTTAAEPGTFYIVILKRHGLSPLPYVLSVTLPDTLQELELGKPTFGAVKQNTMSFFRFYVDKPNTDVEVYLTKLDGDPDCAVSHGEVNAHPTHLSSQWQSKSTGDDEIIIQPDDPKRKMHPTGWFHIGVHGFEDATFSIIVFVETHFERQKPDPKEGYVIEWTELWLGLPQALAAQPGRPANFLFYSQLEMTKLFVNVEALEGMRPDTCVYNCGPDPHMCPWLSPFSSTKVLTGMPASAISNCHDASMRGYNGDVQATIKTPCTDCWYAILVSSAVNRSRFKIQLGAEGRAHPLVEGEPFKGQADANDACSLFVYDLTKKTTAARAAANSTLQLSMTTIYGEPFFNVRKTSEDANLLFSSKDAGEDVWLLHVDKRTDTETVSGTYYIQVCAAGLRHAQFRMQLNWDKLLEESPASSEVIPASPLKMGVGMLVDGEVTAGLVSTEKQDVYLYLPASGGGQPRIRVSVTPQGGRCRLFALARKGGSSPTSSDFKSLMREFINDPQAMATWQTAEDEASEIVMEPTDPKYVAPLPTTLYMFIVRASAKTALNQKVRYNIEAVSGGGVEELPATGVQIKGTLKAGEYRRYRVAISEVGKHLYVLLSLRQGDCDLYVGITADVTSESALLRSEAVGSGQIFIDAFGEINSKHCSEKIISEKGECVYFVAVKGVSEESEYQIQAMVPSATPAEIALARSRKVAMPPGGTQYYYLVLGSAEEIKDMGDSKISATIEVSAESGDLDSFTMKVLPVGEARHPTPEILAKEAHATGSKFAGVWSLKLDLSMLKTRCAGTRDCASLLVLRSSKGVPSGTISVQLDSMKSLDGAKAGKADASESDCLPLEAGVPSRGILKAVAAGTCYSFRVPDADSDVAVTVTPLTACKPNAQALQTYDDIPRKKTLSADARLGFVSQVLRHGEDVWPGLLRIKVWLETTGECQFDIRAQIINGGNSQLQGSGGKELTALLLDAPVYSGSSHDSYFAFTSQLEKAGDAHQRETLEVDITTLSGEIQVACSTMAVQGGLTLEKKRSILTQALKDMRNAPAQTSRGSSQLYACSGMYEGCGEALSCQLLVQVQSTRPGRWADFMAMAVDRGSSQRAQLLLAGVPEVGCVGVSCPGDKEFAYRETVRYQLLINNPVAAVTLRLSCQGSDPKETCSRVLLSADARREMRLGALPLASRAYTAREHAADGIVELEISRSAKDSLSKPGLCKVPCVLHVAVELKAGSRAAAEYQIEAASKDAYSLLLDGGEPLQFVAELSRPEYFLFDSRQGSPLLTLMATVPYDSSDPDGTLVNMYIIDCSKQSGSSEEEAPPLDAITAQDPSLRPSAESYRYRGRMNPRGQLVAHIGGSASPKPRDEGDHCYYRIAVVSHRVQPPKISIRGFDWHPGTPLTIGEPLEGLVDGGHGFWFEIASPGDVEEFVLDLEVCHGDVQLRSAPTAPGQESDDVKVGSTAKSYKGSFFRMTMLLSAHRWLQVSSANGKAARYILFAQDSRHQFWLETASGDRSLKVVDIDGTFAVSWQAAQVFSHGEGSNEDAQVHYEVFYMEAWKLIEGGNFSTACGMYELFNWRRAKRLEVVDGQSTIIKGLKPNTPYLVNVVARSLRTGHTMSYHVWDGMALREGSSSLSTAQSGASQSSFFTAFGPILLAASAIGALAWLRPCRMGSGGASWMELPSWADRTPNSYRTLEAGGMIGGGYRPPSL